jgi:nucleotide-binding universal stress UspA family protein
MKSFSDPISPILIAYDGSDPARHALNEAAALFGSRPVVVITVWEPGLAYANAASMPVIGGGMALNPVDAETGREVDQEIQGHAERVAQDGAKLAKSAGLRAEAAAVPDTTGVAEAIADRAKELDAAAIVIGSRGLSGLRARMEGSTSKAVLKHAPCPVLVVHND